MQVLRLFKKEKGKPKRVWSSLKVLALHPRIIQKVNKPCSLKTQGKQPEFFWLRRHIHSALPIRTGKGTMSITCKCLVKVEIRNRACVRLVAASSYLQWRDGSRLLGSLLSVSLPSLFLWVLQSATAGPQQKRRSAARWRVQPRAVGGSACTRNPAADSAVTPLSALHGDIITVWDFYWLWTPNKSHQPPPFSVSLSACFSSSPQTLQPHTLQSLAMFLFSSFQSVDLQPCGQL